MGPGAHQGVDVRGRLAWLVRPGHGAMVTNLQETFRLSECLRRYTTDPLRFVLGLDAGVTILRDHFYKSVDGGMLEGLGRMLTANTRLDVFAMSSAAFRERLAAHQIEPEFCRVPDKAVLTVEDLQLAPPAGHLLDFLRDAGWVVGVGDGGDAGTP
jgi:hypothetical protein